jgi:DNA helicase-2/ATP-dependent DNA helicase PcrA
MGYGDYLRDNNMDENKLFILEMLARGEKTIPDFLERLETLRTTLTERKEDYRANFILSTIHSSKGLEYDEVVLMDVINGVFPSRIIKDFKTASVQEKRDYEEERRIFYVGLTRAKEKLTLFRYAGEPSIFIGELFPKEKPGSVATARTKKQENALKKPTMLLKKKQTVTRADSVPENLVIGERISQVRYGSGVITDVSWDEDEIPTKFTVEFDDGTERIFMYPFAFTSGMKIGS